MCMNFRITCYTLFDITQTGVLNRSRPSVDQDMTDWTCKRNTQANFDTILQVISLRSQPESLSIPKKTLIKFDDFENFGFLFQQIESENISNLKNDVSNKLTTYFPSVNVISLDVFETTGVSNSLTINLKYSYQNTVDNILFNF